MKRLLPLVPLCLLLLVTMGVGPCDSRPLGGTDSCTYNGKAYPAGVSFPAADGCNTCSCQNGGVACTLLGCIDAGTDGAAGCRDSSGKVTACPGDGGITEGGIACFDVNGKQIACGTDGGAVCTDGGKVYVVGATFTCADGCNTCTCTSSGIVSTKKACFDASADARSDASGDARADASPPSCYYVDGTGRACGFDAGVDCLYGNTFFPVGTSFPSSDGCNTCTCTTNLAVACTAKACADAGARAVCVYANKPYPSGTTFPSIDGCNVCSCTEGGLVSCTERGCSDSGIPGDAGADGPTCLDPNNGKIVPCPADGGPAGVCMPGVDQTCNDSPSVSALLGKCRADFTCDCGLYATNPLTGRCLTTTTAPGCTYAGTMYPVGSKFMCAVDSSCMNAGLCYCATPNTTLPLCPDQPMAACAFDTTYVYGRIGGLTAWTDQVTLAPPASYELVRTASARAGTAAGGACRPALPACSSGSIDVSDIMRDIADPTVQLLLSLSTMQTTLLGVDPRPVDGQVFSFKKSGTAGFLVGSPCNGASSCTEIPGAVANLMADLQKLDAQQRQDPSCAALQK